MLITTSRNPTHFLRRVSNIISLSFPNSQKMNRGSLSLKNLFAYCKNKEFSRLLIFQRTSENDRVIAKAYSIEEKPQSIEATIELRDVISLSKHDKKNRVVIESVQLKFSREVNESKKGKITDFFQDIIKASQHSHDRKVLTIFFRQEKQNYLIGQAVRGISSISDPLYTIHILTECGNNE
jgi:rRNA maturation protein Rpf1